MIRTKLLTPHKEGCHYGPLQPARRRGWFFEYDQNGRIAQMYLSKAGDRRGTTVAWLKLVCNAPRCPASAIVSRDSLLEKVAESLLQQEVRTKR